MFFIREIDKPNLFERKFNIIKMENNVLMIPLENEDIFVNEKSSNSSDNFNKFNDNKKEKLNFICRIFGNIFFRSKKGNNIKNKRIERLALKTRKIIEKNSNSKKIIISKNLRKQILYVNYLNEYGFKIQDGKMLFEILIPQVLDFIIKRLTLKNENNSQYSIDKLNEKNKSNSQYGIDKLNAKKENNFQYSIDKLDKKSDKIQKQVTNKLNMKNNLKYNLDPADIKSCKLQKINKQNTHISILVNDLDDYIFENIKVLALNYHNVNIVSNHIEKFKKLENILLESHGIMLTTINNKKKSLLNSDIIINVDFPSELLNKYIIKDDAIIVNIKNNAVVNKKRFNGIIINDYEISFKDCKLVKENIDGDFYNKDIYESRLYERQNFTDINRKLVEDKVAILYLNAIHGKFC